MSDDAEGARRGMTGTGRLAGKVALLTGGAQGLGAAQARAVVAHGGKVVIGDVDREAGQALAAELGEGAALFVPLDVTSAPDWKQAVDAVVSRFGRLNVLINNAGIVTFGPLQAYRRDQWDAILAVNLTGPFLGITAAREALIAAAPSSIVNISSTAGMVGAAEGHGYTATKFGLRGLTKSVAMELAQYGIRCNSVHPGIIRTARTDGLPVEVLMGPMKRMGEPAEVANLVVYLASDESSFSTGSEFIVDGGQIAGTAAPPVPK